MMMFPARFKSIGDGQVLWQSAQEHCRNTAEYAADALRQVGLAKSGYLAGLLHDCGKFKEEFGRYLQDEHGVRGSVNHTFAGCRLLLELFHQEGASWQQYLSVELLTVAVGGHHGLFDCVDEHQKSGFLHRMTKPNIGYQESKRNFLTHCATEDELRSLFDRAVEELSAIFDRLDNYTEEQAEWAFCIALLARLLQSGVIEGDRRDTAEFMDEVTYPTVPKDLKQFWGNYLEHMENKLAEFPQDSLIQKARRRISDQCRAFAEKPGGVLRLNVPTGGGKTLSSLRYALAHARKWGKRRLIFTSPLLSILEQNAAVLREYLGDDSIILEHHSNVVAPVEDAKDEKLDLRELAVESWNAPVIITTLVQLLNTLFEGRTTAVRRFQGLCNSVIVIDEVQTVPPKMLSMFNLAMDFLAEFCGATVLLCSATQPCLEKAVHPLRCCKGDLVPYDPGLWEPFRRTVITDAGGKTLEGIGLFALEMLQEVQSLLVVCNKKGEAEYLFQNLKGQADVCVHLSASMCVAHRREALSRLGKALEEGKKCLCVSTQVIEAGVDISFQRVIRLAAGMDSVIQAAGRCNRHGEQREPVPVYVVNCQGEELGMLREIREGKCATQSLLYAFERNAERFGNDLSSDAAIGTYYGLLYRDMKEGYQDFYLAKKDCRIFDLLACNEKYWDENADYAEQFCMAQAFKTAGSAFQVFDQNTRDVVVPYGKGAELILELTGRHSLDPAFLVGWTKKAKWYTVAVYDHQIKKLGNAITEYGGVAVLSPDYYDEDVGLTLRPSGFDFLEV